MAEKNIETIIANLSSEDHETRARAVFDIGTFVERIDLLGPAVKPLGALLVDTDSEIRINAAWTLAGAGAKNLVLTDAVHEMVAVLAQPDSDERFNCFHALRCATQNEASAKVALEALENALAGEEGDLRTTASELLTLHAIETDGGKDALRLLEAEDDQVRIGAAWALADAAKEGTDVSAHVAGIAGRLGDGAALVRLKCASALVSLAERGHDIGAATEGLAVAAADEREDVVKEAIWALYVIARKGGDIGAAEAALKACVEKGGRSVKGNAGIGLTLHYLNAGRADAAEALMAREDAIVKFGAAWAYTDYYGAREDEEKLTALFKTIQPGLRDVDQSLRQGIAGSIQYAQQIDGVQPWALGLVQKMVTEAEDPLVQTAVMGILYKMRR